MLKKSYWIGIRFSHLQSALDKYLSQANFKSVSWLIYLASSLIIQAQLKLIKTGVRHHFLDNVLKFHLENLLILYLLFNSALNFVMPRFSYLIVDVCFLEQHISMLLEAILKCSQKMCWLFFAAEAMRFVFIRFPSKNITVPLVETSLKHTRSTLCMAECRWFFQKDRRR